MKKLLSVILALVIAAAPVAVCAAQTVPHYSTECVSHCGGDCEYSPLIVVPGIMQSQVYVQDENGNDLLTKKGFPIVEGMDLQFMFDMDVVKSRLPELIAPFVLSVIKRDRDIFIDAAVKIFGDCFKSHYFNPDSTRVNNVATDEYWYSDEVAKTKPDKSYGYMQGYRKDENGNALPSYKYPTEFDMIKAQVDITSYCEKAGYDHAYYFAYSSFGDTLETAEKLNEYVQMVKAQTGHDKVSFVFVSLGGTIGNAYLAKYCNPDDVDRIIFAAAALDGSYLLSDLMDVNLSLDNSELFYSEMIPLLTQFADEGMEWAGYLLNFVTRAVPNEFFSDLLAYTLNRCVKEVLNNLLINCPSMWALVPSSEYEKMSEKYISDEAHLKLKAKTDEYYEIQKNARNTVKKLSDEGMDIFVISGYNLALPSVISHWNESSDNIIQAESTSMGATFADFGETLPQDYSPAIDESYISPEREVDAGTATLPDRTWFVRNQSHLKLQPSTKDVIELCVQIVINKDITDARVNNGGYPQFNAYRDSKALRRMLEIYDENVNDKKLAALSDDERERLDSAHGNALTVYNKQVWDYDEAKSAEAALYTALYDLKLFDDMDSMEHPFKKYKLNSVLTKAFKSASDIMLKLYGAKDYYTIY